MDALRISTALSSFVSLLLLLISLGSDYWVESSGVNQGLWKSCFLSTCFEIGGGIAKLNAVRAFMLLGMIAGAVSLAGLCATFFRSKLGSVSLAWISAIASFIAGLCTVIAMSVYTSIYSKIYSWSFGLGWATFPLYLITGGLACRLGATEAE